MRAAMIFAQNQKQYQRWRATADRLAAEALTGEALELAVMAIAGENPDLVSVVH